MLAKGEQLSHYESSQPSMQQFQPGSLTLDMADILRIDTFLASSLRAVRAGERAPWSLPEADDTQTVWESIEYHGIPVLLFGKARLLDGWPDKLLERMAEEARLLALWEATHHQSVSELIADLHKAGIDNVVLKGTALAYSLHDDPACRRRGDTDLLVPPRYKDETRAIFKRLGWYLKEAPHGLYYQEGWQHDAAGFFKHVIDLHWEPADRPVLQEILPLEAFFTDRSAIPRLGDGAFRPPLAMMVLHSVINQKWHAVHGYDAEAGRLASPRRLIWSVDFDLMIQAMDESEWRALLDHCTRQRIGLLVAEALRGMQEDLGTKIDRSILKELDQDPLDPALARYFTDHDSIAQFWIDVRKARSLSEKRRLITMRAFPPRDHLMRKYPKASGWPIALLRGRMLIDTAGRVLRKAVSR